MFCTTAVILMSGPVESPRGYFELSEAPGDGSYGQAES
jgi:hypothetical protein